MYLSELRSLHFHFPPPQTTTIPRLAFTGFSGEPYMLPPTHPSHFITSNTNSGDVEAPRALDLAVKRQQRRMISNRESARRSRMRKKRQLDGLFLQVKHLRATNRHVLDELNQMMRQHHEILEENVRLREEESELKEKLKALKGNKNGDNLEIMEVGDGPCNIAHMRKEAMMMSSYMASPLVFSLLRD